MKKHFRLFRLQFVLFIFSPVLIQCSSFSEKTRDISGSFSTEQPLDFKNVVQLTPNGDCYNPSANELGTKVLYVCKNRNAHLHSEIYELSLETGIEKRITYQDGNLNNPIYTLSEKIIYSSNTDENKEVFIKTLENLESSQPMLQSFDESFQNQNTFSEIYMSDRFGRSIERLTTREGFDGRPTYTSGPGWQLYYSCHSQNQNQNQNQLNTLSSSICRLNLLNKKTETFIGKTSEAHDYAMISPDQRTLAWFEMDPQTATSKLNLTALNAKTHQLSFNLPPGVYKDLSFLSMNEILFSFQSEKDSKNKNPSYKIGLFNFITQSFLVLLNSEQFKEKTMKGASLEEAFYIKSKNYLLLTTKKNNKSSIVSIELPTRPQVFETTVANTLDSTDLVIRP
ncbi:MAG TPA: hypothetical protein PLJ21_09700 [Pseudobdellovibrionaceae bacterium]|nr:hypothetical protein [Pseudobdellovibrionaceae bacterium]